MGDVPELAGAYSRAGAGQDAARAARRGHRGGGPGASTGRLASPVTVVEALITKGTSMGHRAHGRSRSHPARRHPPGGRHGAGHICLTRSQQPVRPTRLPGRGGVGTHDPRGIRDREPIWPSAVRLSVPVRLLEANFRRGNWDDDIADLDAIEGNETPYLFYQIAFLGTGHPCGAARRPYDGRRAGATSGGAAVGSPERAERGVRPSCMGPRAVSWRRGGTRPSNTALKAGANSNFTVDAWWITANAAAAADERQALADARDAFLSPLSFPVPTARRSTLSPRPHWQHARVDGMTCIPVSALRSGSSTSRARSTTPHGGTAVGRPSRGQMRTRRGGAQGSCILRGARCSRVRAALSRRVRACGRRSRQA